MAISLEIVQRIERAAEITRVPGLPSIIIGIIDYHGQVLPVFNLREKLGFPAQDISSAWRFLIVQTSIRLLVLMADVVEGVIAVPIEAITPGFETDTEIPKAAFLRLEDGIIFIYDPERFISSEDELVLEDSIRNLGNSLSAND